MSRSSSVERFYDRWAAVYDAVATSMPAVGWAREAAVDSLALEPGETVVEMGCGTGANLPYLREAVGPAGRVVGIDVTAGMLDLARQRIDRAGWGNVHVVRADATRPPIATADAVLSTFVVGMFEDPAVVVEGWLDLLGPGDRIALLDAAPRDRWGPLDAGFRVFVTLGTPPTGRLRYAESPVDELGSRVEAAHRAVAEGCSDVERSGHMLEFVRLISGAVPPSDGGE